MFLFIQERENLPFLVVSYFSSPLQSAAFLFRKRWWPFFDTCFLMPQRLPSHSLFNLKQPHLLLFFFLKNFLSFCLNLTYAGNLFIVNQCTSKIIIQKRGINICLLTLLQLPFLCFLNAITLIFNHSKSLKTKKEKITVVDCDSIELLLQFLLFFFFFGVLYWLYYCVLLFDNYITCTSYY